MVLIEACESNPIQATPFLSWFPTPLTSPKCHGQRVFLSGTTKQKPQDISPLIPSRQPGKRMPAARACGAENGNVPFWIVALAGASRSCRKHKLMVQELLGELVFHEKIRKGYHGNKSFVQCISHWKGYDL